MMGRTVMVVIWTSVIHNHIISLWWLSFSRTFRILIQSYHLKMETKRLIFVMPTTIPTYIHWICTHIHKHNLGPQFTNQHTRTWQVNDYKTDRDLHCSGSTVRAVKACSVLLWALGHPLGNDMTRLWDTRACLKWRSPDDRSQPSIWGGHGRSNDRFSHLPKLLFHPVTLFTPYETAPNGDLDYSAFVTCISQEHYTVCTS